MLFLELLATCQDSLVFPKPETRCLEKLAIFLKTAKPDEMRKTLWTFGFPSFMYSWRQETQTEEIPGRFRISFEPKAKAPSAVEAT